MRKFLLMVATVFVLVAGSYGVLTTRVVNACACSCAIEGSECGCGSRCSGCGFGEGMIKAAECCRQARLVTPCTPQNT